MFRYSVKTDNAKVPKFTPCKVSNFLRVNDELTMAVLVDHFLRNTIEFTGDEINLLTPTEVTVNENTDLNLYSFYCRFVSSPDYIYTIFFAINKNYSKHALCFNIISMYKIVSELFSRAQLRLINTVNVYYIVFKSPHNYDVETSLQFSVEEHGFITIEKFKKITQIMLEEKNDNQSTKRDSGQLNYNSEEKTDLPDFDI